VNGTATLIVAGSGQTPGNAADPNYVAGTGVGGNGDVFSGTVGTAGGDGLIVLGCQ
jgi:hypothetical protein